MKQANLFLIFFLISFSSFSQNLVEKDSLLTIDDISNLTVYLYKPTTDTTGIGGTATVINHKNRYFLLTANHVAKQMDTNSKIIFRIANDKPAIINLKALTQNNQLNWISHTEADLSILEILPIDKNVQSRLNQWSFPSKYIYDGQKTVSRDSDVTFFGYPLLDLGLKHFSPLSFTAYLASGLITAKRYDTKTKCTFYYLDQPSMQGCSGGGVFFSVKKALYSGIKKTILVGVVHGTANDISGGKLAAITPSFYVWDLLNGIK